MAPLPGDQVGFCTMREVAKHISNWDSLSGQGRTNVCLVNLPLDFGAVFVKCINQIYGSSPPS